MANRILTLLVGLVAVVALVAAVAFRDWPVAAVATALLAYESFRWGRDR